MVDKKRSTGNRTESSRRIGRFLRYRPGLLGLALILALVVMSVIPGAFAPYDPNQLQRGMRGASPSSEHLLGNDHLGRDVLSRLIHGSRIALTVGVLATLIATTLGVAIGATAGYFGGKLDSVLSRITDTVMAFPLLVLLIALSAIIGPSLNTVIVLIGLTTWAPYARVVRGDTMSIRRQEFILAAQASGAGHARIIIRHILPNIMGPVIVLATLGIGGVIILEAALSFLGLGVQPPTPSWGGMLSEARAFIRHYPHNAIPPGIMITLTVLAFNLVGDGLRDALDPKSEQL